MLCACVWDSVKSMRGGGEAIRDKACACVHMHIVADGLSPGESLYANVGAFCLQIMSFAVVFWLGPSRMSLSC